MLARIALALALMGGASIARADSIGPCGPGERVVMNDTPPGAMHHGGFHCEPDATAPPPPPSAPPPSPSEVAAAVSAAQTADLEAQAASTRAEADLARMRVEQARATGADPATLAPLEAAATEATTRADAIDARLTAARAAPPPPPPAPPPPPPPPVAAEESSGMCAVSAPGVGSASGVVWLALASLALLRRRRQPSLGTTT